jgi:hypothetical protein
MGRRRLALLVYGVAMGYLEAAVVVYLRRIYYPEGFGFPLAPMEREILLVELGRELATLVMIAAVAYLAARSLWQALLGFCLVFGVWDLAYYGGLKLVLGWPGDLLEPDILFLIPWVWIGPVLAPAGIAASLVAAAWGLWECPYGRLAPRVWEWALLGAAGLVLLATFLVPPLLQGMAFSLEGTGQPAPTYPWWGWFLGMGMAWFVAARWWGRCRRQPA